MKIKFGMCWSLFLLVVMPINAQQFIIDEPGIFGFGVDVTFSPGAPGDSIILVNSSDVIINCDYNTFSQGNTVASTNGIEIAAGLNNVRIQNLRIQDVTGSGIVINEGCSNIIIENLQIEGAGIRGIDFQGTGISPVADCIVRNCTILNSCTNTTSGDVAISLLNGQDSQVKDCIIERCGNGSVNFTGVLFDTCTNCIIEQVKMLTCSGLGVTGFSLSASVRNTIMASAIRNNAAAGPFIGIDISGASNLNNFISECLILRNSATGGTTGVFFGANSQSNVIQGCTVLGNISGGVCRGIHLSGGTANNFNNTLIECLVQSNQTTGGNNFGIDVDGSNFGVIDNCIVSFNSATVTCVGINFNSGTGGSNWLLSYNQIVRNIGFSNATSYGIREQTGTDNLFFNNTAFNNGATAGNQLNGVPAGAITARTTSNLNNNRGATNFQVIP